MTTTPGDQRRFFERLCLLRELYERRGPLDSTAVIDIDAAIHLAWSLGSDSASHPATAPSVN